MSTTIKHPHHDEKKDCCVTAGEFRRLNYFYGQMLSAQDFQTEQSFFREKLKLHNRCLHGYGTVCGLLVEPVPMTEECPAPDEEEEKALREKLSELLKAKAAEAVAPSGTAPGAPPDTSTPVPGDSNSQLDADIAVLQKQLEDFYKKHCRKEPRTRFRITCGLALDCEGNELILRHDVVVDAVERLSNEDYNKVKKGAMDLYVSFCFCEEPIDPVRPVLPEACGAPADCAFSKTKDSVRVEVTTTAPEPDHRCETCCEGCASCCVLLSKIECFIPGEPLHEHQIYNGVRRPLSTYQPTTITGISWKHGHTYTQEEAKRVLGTDYDEHPERKGLEIQFSRPVRSSTIRRGVMDVWVIEGGRGRSGEIYHKPGEFVHKPDEDYVDRIVYRDTTDETLEPGDRVLIILRTSFILDHCCRPVDGEHVGGRVPLLPECRRYHPEPHHEEECCEPPGRPGPWTSGTGNYGGWFESWFFIREEEREQKKTK
jgi:hypothetical protein